MNKLFKYRKYLLWIILLLAVLLRLVNLGTNPPHLTPDEASLGYNAYSILTTGRDEHGEILPTIFKSFGDYKPGLYVYLAAPSVALFGLNEFAVRLPSAISGVIAVWLIYKIVLLLFAKQRNRTLATITALLLAISPWHIHFSRGAWEASVSLTLTLAGIYFFLRYLRYSKLISSKRHVSLIYASAFFSLTLLTYQGAKLATTLVIIALAVTFWREVKSWLGSKRGALFVPIIVGIIITLPVILSLFQGRTGRLEVFSVFSYERSQEDLQVILDQGSENIGSISFNLLHSEGVNFARGIFERWFNHFSTRFLFFEGDWQIPRHSAPNHGMLLLTDLILLLAGVITLLRGKGENSKFILLWLILAPLPAALSRDQVHAVRALNMVIPLTLISAVGLSSIISYFKKFRRLRLASYLIIFVFYLIPFTLYLDSYFVHLPVHDAKHWFYGYKQAIEEITPIQNSYQNIVFQQSYNQPYIYFLFFQQYDPEKYQAQAKLAGSGIDVGLVEKLDNISFSSFSWPYPSDQKGTLVIADSVGIPSDFKRTDYELISEIKYPDNFMTAFRIVEVK